MELETAKYNHQMIAYNPFSDLPWEPLLLTADPWSYLSAWLSQREDEAKWYQTKNIYKTAQYYCDLAESFYLAAERTSLPAKGTLAYYGMMNLVMCYITINRVKISNRTMMHGIRLSKNNKYTVRISKPDNNVFHVFHEFCRLLHTPIKKPLDINIENICCHIPELHVLVSSLGHLLGSKRNILPIKIEIKSFKGKDKEIFSVISFNKREESRVDINKFYTGRRKASLKLLFENDDIVVYRGKKRYSHGTEKGWRINYKRILEEIRALDISSILTNAGYKYYCDLEGLDIHHIAYSLLLIFYIGSVARYRPDETIELMRSDKRPLIADAVKICPYQFLYHIVSLITKKACVVPSSFLRL